MIEKSAKGSVSGSDSRIVIGWSHDSNCAARIRYMNTSDRPKASMKACPVRAEFAGAPREPRAVVRPEVQPRGGRLHGVHDRRLADARAAGSRTR